jgi:integrase
MSRGNNEGSIYFDNSVGLYRAAVTLPDGRRKKVSAKTRADVSRKLTALQGQITAGLPAASTDRLGPFLDWWLTTLEAKASAGAKSVNTVDNARWAVETWIKPALGGKRLREIEPEHVEMLLAKMVADGKARRTVGRVRSYFGQALATAERRNKVARNVARIAEMPATATPAGRRALTPEEAATLLSAMAGHRLEGLFVVGLMLGLRPGELTGLRWTDVDVAGARLVVDVSLKHERKTLRIGETKTAKSRRPLSIPAPVGDALRTHRRRQLEERLQAGVAWQESGLVFTTQVGTPIDPANLRHAFARLTEKAGLGHWTPNELRHSAASLLSAAGVPLEVIADVLGHASTRMLEHHYRHQVKPSIDGHVAVMEQMFGA